MEPSGFGLKVNVCVGHRLRRHWEVEIAVGRGFLGWLPEHWFELLSNDKT